MAIQTRPASLTRWRSVFYFPQYIYRMTILSVNINKFGTLRNSRGGNNPDVVKAAIDAQLLGAAGVTVHPRKRIAMAFNALSKKWDILK